MDQASRHTSGIKRTHSDEENANILKSIAKKDVKKK